VSGTDHQSATVTISGISGKTFIQRELDAPLTRPEQFDLTGYPKGLYMIKIQTEKTSVVRKLVIE
jgi:hypothetical protein